MMRKYRLSLLTWYLVCAVVIFAFLPALLTGQGSRLDDTREPFAVIGGNMEIAFGRDRPESGDWAPLDDDARTALGRYEGTVWLQRTLPELNWRSPYLFFTRLNKFEAFLDGVPLYQFNLDNAHRYINHTKLIHPVSIHPQDGGKQLLIRTEWEGYPLYGSDIVMAGEPDQIIYALIQMELAFIVYSILSLTAGIVGLVLFVRRREAVYGWFSLFCCSMAAACLFSCRSVQWFIPMQEMYYWQELQTPLAIWACIGFYANALGFERKPLYKGAHYAMALYVLMNVLAAIGMPELFRKAAVDANTFAAFAGFVIVTYLLIRYRVRKGSQTGSVFVSGQRRIRLWLMRGYWTFTLCVMAGFGASMWPTLLIELLNTHLYWFRVIEGLLANGLLLFIICMVMVLISRVRLVHLEAERNAAELLVKNKELEQFHHHLERLVERRTAELEQANRTLSATLREKAETLAEMSVLEERSRIAYEMHDVVGHTLTAAIVQLEATKKLAERHHAVSFEKLDLLIELVRKGLDDIRKAVKLLKTDEVEPLSLADSLRELIQYTEDTMEIEMEADIAIPANLKLGRMTEHVLYHALQEGLTNGIRHGRCRSACFRIYLKGHTLKFRLTNDGDPFGSAVPGFGLSSMAERVQLLGGELRVRSSAGEDGEPRGCELSIDLPLT